MKIEVVETKGLIGFLRFNQLFPPFDNPAIRRAVLQAVNQTDFMEAVVGGNASYDAKTGFFTPGTPMASDAGMQALSGPHDAARSSRDWKRPATRARGSFISPLTDVPRINAIAEVGADMLRKIGMNVDEVSTDWGTPFSARSAASRRTRAGGTCSPRSPAATT